jgi:hypothetical protein
MKRHLIPLALVVMVGLSACATAAPSFTPFQAAVPGKFGFTEQRIEAARYRVIFEGNSRTTRQRVEDSLLLRAANVTLENGYDWFEVVSRATDPKTYEMRMPSMSSSWGGGFGYHGGFSTYRSWSPRYGWIYHRDPFAFSGFHDNFGGRDDVREITRYQANAEIILGKGPKPADRADAFDARDVSANLTPRLSQPVPQTIPSPAP